MRQRDVSLGRRIGAPVVRGLRAAVPFACLVLAGEAARAQGGDPARTSIARVGDDVVIEIGPVELPPADGRGSVAPPAARVVMPVSGWLNGFRLELVDAQGSALSTDLVTVNVLSLGERELFAPVSLRLAAVAPGTPAVVLPRLIGYRATRGDTLLVTARFHPQASRAYRGVRARLRFPYVSAAAFIGAIRIQPFALEVMAPGGPHEYDLPPGRSERFWEGPPAFDGRILGMGGYAKGWATALRFEDRTTGRVLWAWRAGAAADGAVPAIPIKRFLATFGLSVRRDHVYRLTVEYDNASGRTIRDGGVGTIAGVFVPTGEGPWPAADAADSVYRADLRGFLR